MLDNKILLKAYRLMFAARTMAETYESNRQVCRYVHSTSRGHEAIQLATAFQLLPCDFVSPYYRDESLLLGLGFSPYELMLQLLAKADDIFTGGREYYSHPNYKGSEKPTIIHQSSATGMQAIPTTGIAQGIKFLEMTHSPLFRKSTNDENPIVICSIGDASITEGEVSEALQFAVLKKLPIIYLVQDNDWGISVTSHEARVCDAYDFAAGFPGMNRIRIDGSNFEKSFYLMEQVVREVREQRLPYLVHAKVPLLGHHTSGVRKEFYRTEEDLLNHSKNDPGPKLRLQLLERGVEENRVLEIEKTISAEIQEQFEKAVDAAEPNTDTVEKYVFAQTPVTEEKGQRQPSNKTKVMMVDAAL
ncbi:MAG: thiamine pyrophosphate-dependent dehydrogenase E1 component subunit alpha, partial [Flavitalea sp.]